MRPPGPAEEDTIGSAAQARADAWPTATYRVQLNAAFTFDDAATLAPYLSALGVSHLYCSPVLQAAPGSTHGYDVVDHRRLSAELGGAAGFERLAEALAARGISIVLDIVPNHMALAGRANRWWWDVLEDGPTSPYADHFDIDWTGLDPDGGPVVLMPILDDHLGRVLEAGRLGLRRVGGTIVVTHHDQEVPLSPRSTDQLLAAAAARAGSTELTAIAGDLGALPGASRADAAAVDERQRGKVALRQRLAELCEREPVVARAVDEELAALTADPEALDALLARQSYRLAWWRTADEELNYRRFFSITTLAGLRAEDEHVFAASHELLGELGATGRVTGLRVDHVDGLRNPAAYLHRLRALAPDAYVVVEKILQPGEELPESWPVAGTSGYDQLVALDRLFVDAAAEPAMTAGYHAFVGDDASFAEVAHEARLHVAGHELAAETERLTTLLAAVCAERPRHRDHPRPALRDLLREVLAGMDVYRTYVVPGETPTPADRQQVATALGHARDRRPDLDPELLELLGRVLLLEEPGEAEAELAVRFQQVSAPVMAKGVEDTAFYRYHRLVSLNEVGGDPATFGGSVAAFHERGARLAERWPHTMVTLSTHDTKRSGDVRARIDLISELPGAWWEAVGRWASHNERHRPPAGPDRPIELLLYQTLVGAWPIETDRLVAWMAKAAREAKVHTSWTTPVPAYEEAVAAFTTAVVDDPVFVADLEAFLDAHQIVARGRETSLAQTALLVTAPGVPDVYQGTELWDLSLADPDNRRPVDHEVRARLLRELLDAPPEVALAHLADGGTKLWLLAQLLRHRRLDPAPYRSARYAPLAAHGPKERHVVAFERAGLAVVVPRLLVGLDGAWRGTTVSLPPGPWRDVLTGDVQTGGERAVAELLARFPAAVLVPETA
jgi:(1->4)-alpha-D-glucan 1-alpha-D-glucosylmutase